MESEFSAQFELLPVDLLQRIYCYLGPFSSKAFRSARLVCRRWYQVSTLFPMSVNNRCLPPFPPSWRAIKLSFNCVRSLGLVKTDQWINYLCNGGGGDRLIELDLTNCVISPKILNLLFQRVPNVCKLKFNLPYSSDDDFGDFNGWNLYKLRNLSLKIDSTKVMKRLPRLTLMPALRSIQLKLFCCEKLERSNTLSTPTLDPFLLTWLQDGAGLLVHELKILHINMNCSVWNNLLEYLPNLQNLYLIDVVIIQDDFTKLPKLKSLLHLTVFNYYTTISIQLIASNFCWSTLQTLHLTTNCLRALIEKRENMVVAPRLTTLQALPTYDTEALLSKAEMALLQHICPNLNILSLFTNEVKCVLVTFPRLTKFIRYMLDDQLERLIEVYTRCIGSPYIECRLYCVPYDFLKYPNCIDMLQTSSLEIIETI